MASIDFGGVGTSGTPVSGQGKIKTPENSSVTGKLKVKGGEGVAVEGSIAENSSSESSSPLIYDNNRKSRYDSIVKKLDESGQKPTPLDVEKLRSKQKEQSSKVEEDKSVKANRKHFLKTMFSMKPEDVKKKSS